MPIKGISFPFESGALILAPLTLGTLEAMQDRIEALKGGTDPQSVSTVIDIALASLRRNYPEMTRDQVAELVDVGNMTDVVHAAMDVSGIRRKAQEADPGEATAPSTGGGSTPA